MDQYAQMSYASAKLVTARYSTSFSLSSRLFASSIRPHIYAIYGLVRIADEIVDSYKGGDAPEQLDALQHEVQHAIQTAHSTNPIVHAFALTARQFAIDDSLIDPFFDSMRMDLQPTTYDLKQYKRYIYGSAEVIGLMCLKIFVAGNSKQYQQLSDSARALGAAYQKINFLRDLRADHTVLGRMYFPGVNFASFSEANKRAIIADITQDVQCAKQGLQHLPRSARRAVTASLYYYEALLQQLKTTPATEIAKRRIRVADWRKFLLLARAGVGL